MAQKIKTANETLIVPDSSEERFLPIQDDSCRILRDLNITMAGLAKLKDNFICDRKGIWVHLLLYTISGEGKLEHVPGTKRLKPGSLFIAPAWTRYSYTVSKKPWQIIWFHLYTDEPWGTLEEQQPHVRRSYLIDEIFDTTKHLLTESVRHESHSQRMMELYSEQITLILRRELESEFSAHDRRIGQQVAIVGIDGVDTIFRCDFRRTLF